MQKGVQFWQLILSIFLMLVGFGAFLNGVTNRTQRAETQIEGIQKQVDELKTNNTQMKVAVDDIKDNVSDIKGDVKVLLSKMK